MAQRINRTLTVPASKTPPKVVGWPAIVTASSLSSASLWMIGAGVALLFLLFMASLWRGSTCVSVTDKYAGIISEFQQKGQWQQATDTASLALATPHLCPNERDTFAKMLISSGLEALYAQHTPPQDRTSALATVEGYQTLLQQAVSYQVPFPATPIQVAQRVYKTQNFRLAKYAFEQAIEAGEITSRERELMQQYCSTLYNLGYWGVRSGDSSTYEEGVSLLVASYAIDNRYQLNIREAWGELKRLYGADEQKWPTTAAPTNASGRGGEGASGRLSPEVGSKE